MQQLPCAVGGIGAGPMSLCEVGCCCTATLHVPGPLYTLLMAGTHCSTFTLPSATCQPLQPVRCQSEVVGLGQGMLRRMFTVQYIHNRTAVKGMLLRQRY
jgi:hypothetical protein